MLSQHESKIGRALAGGHLPSLAKSILGHEQLRKALFQHFLDQIDNDCSRLCQRQSNTSVFRKVPQPLLSEFKWKDFVDDLQVKAPTLFQVLSTVSSHNDQRNKIKTGERHNPGIYMAAAVLLKERNREMNGLPSIVSLLLFSSHVSKQVYQN